MKTFWILVGMLLILAFYLGWIALTASTDKTNDTSKIEIDINHGKAKQDAVEAKSKLEELGEKIKEGAQGISSGGKSDTPAEQSFTLSSNTVKLSKGTTVKLTALRPSRDTNLLQLGLAPSDGSNLLVTGGLFETNKQETEIVIDAPKDAANGKVTVSGNGHTEVIVVEIMP